MPVHKESWAAPPFYNLHLAVLNVVIENPPSIRPYDVYIKMLERFKETRYAKSFGSEPFSEADLRAWKPNTPYEIMRRFEKLGYLKKAQCLNSKGKRVETYSLNKERVKVLKSASVKKPILAFIDSSKPEKLSLTIFADGATPEIKGKIARRLALLFD